MAFGFSFSVSTKQFIAGLPKTDMVVTQVSLAYALHAIHVLSVLLSPYLPTTAQKIQAAFGKKELLWKDALQFPEAGTPLVKPDILFQRMEDEIESD